MMVTGENIGTDRRNEYVIVHGWKSYSTGNVNVSRLRLVIDDDGMFIDTQTVARAIYIEEGYMITEFDLRANETESYFLSKLGNHLRLDANFFKHNICLFADAVPRVILKDTIGRSRGSVTSGEHTPVTAAQD